MPDATLLYCEEIGLLVREWLHGTLDAVGWCVKGSPHVATLHEILLRREPKTWHMVDGLTGERTAFAGYLTRLSLPPRRHDMPTLVEVHVSVTMTGPLWRDDDTPVPEINVREPMWDPVTKEYV